MRLQFYKSKHYLFVLLKWAVIVMAFYAVYLRLAAEDFSIRQLLEIAGNHKLINVTTLLLMAAFSVANWFVEIIKWQYLAGVVCKLSFREAARQTLCAQTLAMITPGRLGEYGGKSMFFPAADWKKVVKLTFYHNMHQLFFTVVFGLGGLCYMGYYLWAASVFLVGTGVLALAVAFKRKVINNYSVQQLWVDYLGLPAQSRNVNFVGSCLRYLIFAHQYYILLLLFGITLHYGLVMCIIASIYLVASVLPVITMLDVVVKTGVAVYLLGRYHVPAAEVLSVSLMMWFCNMALPGLLGTYTVMRYNLKRSVVW